MACAYRWFAYEKKWWSMAEVEATKKGLDESYSTDVCTRKKNMGNTWKKKPAYVSPETDPVSLSLSVDQGVTAPNRAWRYFHEVPGSQVRTKTSQRSTIRLCFKSGCQLRQRIKPLMVKFLPLRWPRDVYRAAPMARPGSTEWSAQAWRTREFEPQWGDPSPTVSGLESVMKAHM